MVKFLIKRILLMIPVLLGVILIVFFVSRAMPGDPVAATFNTGYTEEEYHEMAVKMGLDKPVGVQLVNYIWGIVTRFDLGDSYSTGNPVTKELLPAMLITLRIGVMAIALTAIVGIPIGIISATKQYSPIDYAVTVLAIFFAAMPGFWLGLMCIIIFVQKLGWLPATGLATWKHYILPVVCNSIMSLAITTRMTRSSMLEVIHQDYIVTARAKGVKEGTIITKHALKNAIIPVVTVIGNQCSIIVGGSIVIEAIFTINGVGTLLLKAVNARDYACICGSVFLVAIFVCILNLIVDIVYCIVDPRMKAQLIGTKKRKKAKEPVKGGAAA